MVCLFKKKGLKPGFEELHVTPGSFETCVSLLNKGEIIALSPGDLKKNIKNFHKFSS